MSETKIICYYTPYHHHPDLPLLCFFSPSCMFSSSQACFAICIFCRGWCHLHLPSYPSEKLLKLVKTLLSFFTHIQRITKPSVLYSEMFLKSVLFLTHPPTSFDLHYISPLKWGPSFQIGFSPINLLYSWCYSPAETPSVTSLSCRTLFKFPGYTRNP